VDRTDCKPRANNRLFGAEKGVSGIKPAHPCPLPIEIPARLIRLDSKDKD